MPKDDNVGDRFKRINEDGVSVEATKGKTYPNGWQPGATWDGRSGENLLEQHYNEEDDRAHLTSLVDAFKDPRYIKVEDKPLFLVYRAGNLPDPLRTTTVWREEASKLGVGDIYLCRVESMNDERNVEPASQGFDAAVDFQPDWSQLRRPFRPLRRSAWQLLLRNLGLAEQASGVHRVYEYADVVNKMLSRPAPP